MLAKDRDDLVGKINLSPGKRGKSEGGEQAEGAERHDLLVKKSHIRARGANFFSFADCLGESGDFALPAQRFEGLK
jgi:hypothetical protein